MYKVLSIKYWVFGIRRGIIYTRFLLVPIALLATFYLLLVGTPAFAATYAELLTQAEALDSQAALKDIEVANLCAFSVSGASGVTYSEACITAKSQAKAFRDQAAERRQTAAAIGIGGTTKDPQSQQPGADGIIRGTVTAKENEAAELEKQAAIYDQLAAAAVGTPFYAGYKATADAARAAAIVARQEAAAMQGRIDDYLSSSAAGAAPQKRDGTFSLAPDCDPTKPPASGGCNVESFIALIKKIINYLFVISVPIVIGFIVYGAFVMIISAGNPTGFQNGRKIIVSAIVGMVIMLTATLFVQLLTAVLKGVTQ